MNSGSRIRIIIAVLIIGAIMCIYAFSVEDLKKIPQNYVLISEHEGQDQVLESLDGEISKPFWIRESLRQEAVSTDGNILEIKSTVSGVDSATNQKIFENIQTYYVDRNTRFLKDSQDYFMFPPNVQKHDYEFFHPMVFAKATFVFDKVSQINGLEVYDFTCQYSGIDVSSAFPQFPSKKILSDGKCTASVEPVTGIVVAFSKHWDDYCVEDGIRTKQIELGGKQTTEYSKLILVDTAKSTKSLYYFYDIVIPVLIVIIGIISISVILLFEKTKRQSLEIIEAQNEMLKKEKLSAIGEITSKISHDLRNPVSIIKMATDAIQMRVEKKLDPQLDQYVSTISEALFRINHQVNQILGYVKITPPDFKLVSVSTILNDVIKHIIIPKNITIEVPSESFSIMADKIQIAIAFTNIITNSIEAIGEDKGKITIRAKSQDNNLVLEFEDSGIGIPKENLSKIFEPLFTTKPHGTGLGLSSVRDIIEAHNGKISVSSPPTIFKVTLPLQQSKTN